MSIQCPLAPDPAVPHLAALLDPATVTEALGRELRARVEPVVPVKIKYRVGEHLRVVHATQVAGERRLFALRSLGGTQCAHAGGTPSVDVNPALCVLSELNAGVWEFPADRRLPGVRSLFSPSPSLARRFEPAWVSSRLAGYAPEKAVVVQCLDAAGAVVGFAKQYASADDASQAYRLHGCLVESCRASRHLRFPRLRGLDLEAHVVLTEPARGRRMTDGDGMTAPVMRRLGRAVASLHGLPAPPHAPAPRRLTSGAIGTAGSVLARAMPARASRVADLVAGLEGATSASEPDVTLHGDLHPKNVFIDHDVVWLIDLDQAARGPAVTDLASVVALLRSLAVTADLDRQTAERLEIAFLEGYAEVRSLPFSEVLERHVAAALLTERALRAVTRVRRALLDRFDALLDEATAALRKANHA